MSNPVPGPVNKRVKRLLAAIRKKTGHNRAEVAVNLNVSQSALTHLCSGRAKAPSSKTLERLSVVYTVRPDWLLQGRGEMFDGSRKPFYDPRGITSALRGAIVHEDGSIESATTAFIQALMAENQRLRTELEELKAKVKK